MNLTFLTSGITCLSVSIAWLAFRSNINTKKSDRLQNIENLISLLELEFKNMELWVGHSEGGYAPLDITEAMKKIEYQNWYDPTRIIFPFNYDILQKTLDSVHFLSFNNKTKEQIIKLIQSIRNFSEYYTEYRKFAFSSPTLYSNTKSILNKKFTQGSLVKLDWFNDAEKNYALIIFSFNNSLHTRLISDKNNPNGLNHNLAKTRKALEEEKINISNMSENILFKISDKIVYIIAFTGIILLLSYYLPLLYKIILCLWDSFPKKT